MTLLGISLVLLGSIAGASDAPADTTAAMPDCVREWMDTAPEWRAFQVATEDSLEAERTRRRIIEGQLALANLRLEWEKESQPSWLDRWLLPVAAAAGVIVGTIASR